MRFVLYNIRYGTGTGWQFHMPLPFSGYLRRPKGHVLALCNFLQELEPDIIGLVEVDNGSMLTERRSQAEAIAEVLGFAHVYESKYAQASFAQRVPVLKQQGNAFLTNQSIRAKDFHYFDQGVKRLVIELELETCVIFLVHLSIRYRHRQDQLGTLYRIFNSVKKPIIVAGDFNAFWGQQELELFQAATGLESANVHRQPTFPCRIPRMELDFILHSKAIKVSHFEIPRVTFSDHLPLVCDFELP
jgi:endonuclease/exonuclease/phosphatase family metal-dependent hydrolase